MKFEYVPKMVITLKMDKIPFEVKFQWNTGCYLKPFINIILYVIFGNKILCQLLVFSISIRSKSHGGSLSNGNYVIVY